jgi:hypothetical protein
MAEGSAIKNNCNTKAGRLQVFLSSNSFILKLFEKSGYFPEKPAGRSCRNKYSTCASGFFLEYNSPAFSQERGWHHNGLAGRRFGRSQLPPA